MRATLVLASSLLLLPLVVPNAVAASSCGGYWNGSATCAFVCDSPTITVDGYAQNGGLASVTVVAECGVLDPVTGAFTALSSVSCSASAPFTVSCANAGPNPHHPLPLSGRCTVTGAAGGTFGCKSL